MNEGLHIFAGVICVALVFILIVALALMTAYAIDRQAFDRKLDEMKASAVEVVKTEEKR